MTTPYQTAPDGAFVVGGGTWNYGQTMNADLARASFEFPMPNPTNMLDLLRLALEQLPLDALKPFADFLGIVDGVFTGVGMAVDAIIDALQLRPVFMAVQEFVDWVAEFFNRIGMGLWSGDWSEFQAWWEGTIIEPIEEAFVQLGNFNIDLGGAIDDIAEGAATIGANIDGFIRGILGWIDSGFNVNIVEQTAADLAATIAGMSAIIAELQKDSTNGSYSGNAVAVNFSSMPPAASLGGDWSQSYPSGSGAGTLGITAGRARYTGTASNRVAFARYTAKQTISDYQKVGAAFATAPSINLFGGDRSYNSIISRCNAAGNTYVFVDLYANEIRLGTTVAGATTLFATTTDFRFKPGAAYWLESGTFGGARIFRVWENKTVLMTYTDASVISQLGADYRYTGMRMMARNNNYLPAQCATFAFYDNTPAAIKGCGWRISRTSGANGNFSVGNNLFPTSWFNTVEYMSPDLLETYDPVNNKIIVPADGWYQVQIIQYGDNGIGPFTGGLMRAGVALNGTVVQLGQPSPSNIAVGYTGFGGAFTVYCQAGDELQPAYGSTWSATGYLENDAGGLGTYWSGTFLGNQKPI